MADIKEFMGKKQPIPGQQFGINVDLNTLPDVCCIKCGGKEFISVVRIKEMSATISPNGKEGTINLNMLRCKNDKCNWTFNAKEYGDWKTIQEGKTMAVKETPSFGDKAEVRILKKDDELDDSRIMCRKCGLFFNEGDMHNCSDNDIAP